MKFKKIEISAFRIYDKPENATFDFSIGENDTADFVSLYAPNGYGKTSFYDAVEWGMTNNIQRFWQNKSLTNGAIDALKSQSDEQVKLWRNIHSSEPTYVKILGEGIDPIDRQLRPHGNKKSDADIENVENLDNRTFRKVILSQEWISAFLREIDGSKRYEIFMDNPELKDINKYYKNLKALLNYCQSNISSIEGAIKEEQNRITALESENILEKINQQIDTLTEKFDQPGLKKLTLKTSKEEISRLKNLVADRLVSINDERAIREQLDLVSAAKVGNEGYIGIRTYFDLESTNKVNLENQRITNGILTKFDIAEKKANELDTLNSLLFEKELKKTTLSELVDQFDEYSRVSDLLLDSESRRDTIRKEINIRSDAQRSLDILETETRADLNNKLATINQITTTIAALPERFQIIQRLHNEITTQRGKIDIDNKELKNLEDRFKSIEFEIKALEDELSNINEGKYTKNLIDDDVLAASIDIIQKNNEAFLQNEELRKSLSARISQQETLNSEISDFIRKGLDIVNRDTNRNNCPLCEQVFKSHEELAQRIAGNNALDEMLKVLLVNKNELDQEASRLRELMSTATGQLSKYFEGKIKDKSELRSAISDHIKTLNKTIITFENSLQAVENDLRELTIEQLGLSDEEYESELKKNLEILRQEEESLNTLLKNQGRDKKEISDLLVKLGDEQKLLVETIGKLQQSEQYVAVLAWFFTNFGTEDISFKKLQDEVSQNDRLIQENFEKISEIRTELESLSLELSSFNQQMERERLKNLIEEKERADIKIDNYRSLLKDKLQIQVQFIDYNTLEAMLDLKEKGFNVALLRTKSLMDEYVKIDRYADNINDFLQSENAKIALEKLNKEKDFLEENVRSVLYAEILKTKSHLQEKVKEFFYEDLINDLYRKIDPHPDFKEVHFSADFDADIPRLDVFVSDKVNKKVELIPNLYFSTAQINILSLSIFLASALNNPDYDCIFIDDPIQSMDSVNVLSTIDLLRSIVINYKKQIVLSTHDETFFNLLKKKLPIDRFKSKFLELESVGKLKSERG